MKKLIPAIALLLVSAAMMSTATFAWFSMNKTVTASGMQVKAQAEGSIVITSGALPTAGLKATDYTFGDASATALYASTHDADYTTYPTGLKHVTNAELINLETGIKLNNEAGTVLGYADAANASPVVYFKDYSIFIAGDGQAFSSQDLTVTLSGSWTTMTNTINRAISVDFYAAAVTSATPAACSQANYKGTLNVAGKLNNAGANGVTDKINFEIDNIGIPQTGTNAAYAVTMRVYFDGALIETGGTNAYTTYEAAPAGACEAGKYYYTDSKGTSVATVIAGTTPTTGLYVVSSTDSTYAYARTTSVANIQDVTLVATFVAAPHS